MFSSGRRHRMLHGIEPLICGQNAVGKENPMMMTGTFSSQPKYIYEGQSW